jgi:hypothetical protein
MADGQFSDACGPLAADGGGALWPVCPLATSAFLGAGLSGLSVGQDALIARLWRGGMNTDTIFQEVAVMADPGNR